MRKEGLTGMKELKGKAQTVLGLIEPDNLGITLPHEHFLVDLSIWFRKNEPTAAGEKLLAYQPVNLANLWWITYHALSNLDNTQLLDEHVAIREALHFRHAGGSSIVDMSNIGLGRDPLALARISRATGLNIIMGSGYYVPEAQPEGVKLDEQGITEQIVQDITVGVGGSGIRAGMIGEIGLSMLPMNDGEKQMLRAVARAQIATGAPVNIHPANSPDSPFAAIEVLTEAGADTSRVVISHIDRTIVVHDVRVRLAKIGCYLEYDLFGVQGYFPKRMVLSEANPIKVDVPNDAQRISEIKTLIGEGFLNQILISHDICTKNRLCCYGGAGYAHVLRNVVPLMREMGMTEEQIHTILVENPKRLLTFV